MPLEICSKQHWENVHLNFFRRESVHVALFKDVTVNYHSHAIAYVT